MSKSKAEYILFVIKPWAVLGNQVGPVLTALAELGCTLYVLQSFQLMKADVRTLYGAYEDRAWYANWRDALGLGLSVVGLVSAPQPELVRQFFGRERRGVRLSRTKRDTLEETRCLLALSADDVYDVVDNLCTDLGDLDESS